MKFFSFNSSKAFTMIELMVVMAIIGLLAAIAIPNFISFRNKAYCAQAEHDADSIASAIANYFGNAYKNETPDLKDLKLTFGNSIEIKGVDPNTNITIIVTDLTQRCPIDYQAQDVYWTDYIYTKHIR